MLSPSSAAVGCNNTVTGRHAGVQSTGLRREKVSLVCCSTRRKHANKFNRQSLVPALAEKSISTKNELFGESVKKICTKLLRADRSAGRDQ